MKKFIPLVTKSLLAFSFLVSNILASNLSITDLPTRNYTPEAQVRWEMSNICQRFKGTDNVRNYHGEIALMRTTALLEHHTNGHTVSSGLLLQTRILHTTELQSKGKQLQVLEQIKTIFHENPQLTAQTRLKLLNFRILSHFKLSNLSLSLPFAGKEKPENKHMQLAGDAALQILQIQPNNMRVRWFLNLARMATKDYPQAVPENWRLPANAFPQEVNFPAWKNLASVLGVDAFDLAGAGIMDDFDGDGFLDLLSSTNDPCDGLKAFRNKGDGTFEDVSEAWGLSHQLGGLNMVHADYDGDGQLDLLVLRGGWLGGFGRIRNSLLQNRLKGKEKRFVDTSRYANVDYPARPTQVAVFADYDNDGDLDFYVANEIGDTKIYSSQLFQNQGNGKFIDVAKKAGLTNELMAKGAAWGDFDNDGDEDLFVSNIGTNRLYRNNADGTFTDIANEQGVTDPDRSFTSWFFDYDNDGWLDLFVADYGTSSEKVMTSYFNKKIQSGQPAIYHNNKGKFENRTQNLGIHRPMLPMGANFGDLENDGFPDIYLGTGKPGLEVLVPNNMLHNHHGKSFSELEFSGGFAQLNKGHGVAFGDLDNDGDQDLFHQLGGFLPGDRSNNALFENPGNKNGWITLRLHGKGANTFAVGARIQLKLKTASGEKNIFVRVDSGGSFGGNSFQQEIGLGDASAIIAIIIHWPGNGEPQIFEAVKMNQIYKLLQGEELQVIPLTEFTLGLPI